MVIRGAGAVLMSEVPLYPRLNRGTKGFTRTNPAQYLDTTLTPTFQEGQISAVCGSLL